MIAAIIQARTGSTRLPRKTLMPILGKPMLEWQIQRLQRAKTIEAIVIATTGSPEDDTIETVAKRLDVTCFRGSERDVLDRYYQAAKKIGADTVVRITGDCPLHDPVVVDLVVEHFQKADVDYANMPENYPEGLDTEVFTFAALDRAWREAKLPSEREHVTPYIRNHPEFFHIDPPWSEGSGDYRSYHWSVDTEADFRFVKVVYQRLGGAADKNAVLDLLTKDPELMEINKGGTGYEGLERSLKEDKLLQAGHE